MYSWGGDTSNWRGKGRYNYDKARSPYLKKLERDSRARGPRTYTSNREADMSFVNTRKNKIKSNSQNPVIFGIDVTGSMSTWPAEFFDRAPLLYQTLSQYRQDIEISFGAIGDATCDIYPIQVNDFKQALALEDCIKAIGCEGGGGGQITESYELFAYFMNNHCETPNAQQPFMFIYGDERFYPKVDRKQAEHYIGDKLTSSPESKEVFQELSQKFNVYLLHKPYGHGNQNAIDQAVVGAWKEAIGEEKVIEIPGKERAVDIAMAIIARSWGQFNDFRTNLAARQAEQGVRQSVYDAIEGKNKPDLTSYDPDLIIFRDR